MASKSHRSALGETSLPVYTLFVPQGLAVSVVREEGGSESAPYRNGNGREKK